MNSYFSLNYILWSSLFLFNQYFFKTPMKMLRILRFWAALDFEEVLLTVCCWSPRDQRVTSLETNVLAWPQATVQFHARVCARTMKSMQQLAITKIVIYMYTTCDILSLSFLMSILLASWHIAENGFAKKQQEKRSDESNVNWFISDHNGLRLLEVRQSIGPSHFRFVLS